MSRVSWKIVALLPGALLLAAAATARADTADRFIQTQENAAPEVPELPQPVAAAVPGIGTEFDALKADPAMAGLTVDWEGLKAYYAAHNNNAIWTHANGFSIQGQGWIAQIPSAVTAGLPLPQQTLLRIAGMTPPADAVSQTRDEALMSAVFVASAVEAVGPLGDPKRRGAGVLDAVARAKDPQRDEPAMARLLPLLEAFTPSSRSMKAIIKPAAGRQCEGRQARAGQVGCDRAGPACAAAIYRRARRHHAHRQRVRSGPHRRGRAVPAQTRPSTMTVSSAAARSKR